MSDTDSDSESEVIADDPELLDSFENQLTTRNYYRAKSGLLKNSRFSPILRKVNMPDQTQNLPTQLPTIQLTQTQPPQPNVVEGRDVQLLLSSIPDYSPGQNLSIFINEVDNLLTHLNNRLTPDLSYIVNFSIRSKIRGDAREYIAYQGATEWPVIRKALLQRYGDQRSEELLKSALMQCIQVKGENYMQYHARLLKHFNDIMQYISLHESNQQFLEFKKLTYSQLALKTFQIGLLEPHRSYLGNFEIHTIEECLNKCQHFDNRRQEWEYCEFIRKSQENSKKVTSPPNKPFSVQYHSSQMNHPTPSNYRYFSNGNNNTSTSQTVAHTNTNPRPFGSINRPLPMSRNLPTNRQVFGTKPGSNIIKQFPKPTPMSISTRFHNNQSTNNWQGQNKFQSTGKPNFHVEELFNLETENAQSSEIVNESDNLNECINEFQMQEPIETAYDEIEGEVNFQTPAFENSST